MDQELLFDSSTWLVWLAPLVGILAAGLSRRRDPRVEGARVFRHDVPARITHWAHGLGTAVLIVSGFLLGFLFMPSALGSGQPVWTAMNVHFVAVIVFLFGTFYYGANLCRELPRCTPLPLPPPSQAVHARIIVRTPTAVRYTTAVPLPEWRNGRRGGLKNLWGKPRVGSTPTSGTICDTYAPASRSGRFRAPARKAAAMYHSPWGCLA